MKRLIHPAILTTCASLTLVPVLPSSAQETTVEKTTKSTTIDPSGTTESTTTTMGTISEIGDQRIIVRTESRPDPVTYSFSKTTTYVDDAGAPVSIEMVKSGLPVTVHYTKVGDEMIASKVIVRKKTTTTTTPAGRSETTTTTTRGTVSELGPDALVVRTTSSPSPVRYKFTKTTTYVDEAGKPVSIQTVKSGLPVTVHYEDVGGSLVAQKVIVRRATTKSGGSEETTTETKTTTSAGTINEFGPERFVIRTESSPDPLTYSYTKTTTYVDEAGAPVSMELVKSGLPVTVHYTTEGDARVATKVIVRKKTTTVTPR